MYKFINTVSYNKKPPLYRCLQYYYSKHSLHQTHSQETTKHEHEILEVKPVIGLEVHAQLKTKAKLFSLAGNDQDAFPNSQLDYHDLAIPGSLPLLNYEALKAAIITSTALNCEISNEIHFDRKHYFYPDMPQGYQITQKEKPLATRGFIEYVSMEHHRTNMDRVEAFGIQRHLKQEPKINPILKRANITQVQLEQDSAKSFHEKGFTLVDFNRCGTGLIEIVFEPDITTYYDAACLVRELISILTALNTCDCQLEEGSLRVDANVSIAEIDGRNVSSMSGKVELKNLNSLQAMKNSIRYEINRQVGLLKQNSIIPQETRTYCSKKKQTMSLRMKEDHADYKFIGEPCIPPIVIEKTLVDQLCFSLPSKLPQYKRNILTEKYNVNLKHVPSLLERPDLYDLFLSVMDENSHDVDTIVDFILYTFSKLEKLPVYFEDSKIISTKTLKDILDLIFQEKVGFENAYELVKYYYVNKTNLSPSELVDQFKWEQINDEDEIYLICRDISKNMFLISKKYRKTREVRFLRMMLEKMNDVHNRRVNMRLAIKSFNKLFT